MKNIFKSFTPNVTNLQKGYFGEYSAKKFLEYKGYQTITTNWTCNWGEIDLVMRDVNTKELVFVEVKFRFSDYYGTPEQSLTYHKRRALQNSINQYLAKNNLIYKDIDWRLDLVSILKIPGKLKIDHYENVILL